MAKTIKTPLLHRTIELDRKAIDEQARTIELSFSSEAPVERWFGYEILDHDTKSVDLRRLRNNAPLLVEHRTGDQVGVVVSAKIEDRRGKALVRFGKSARANEIFEDVKDGIRTLVSVGYKVDKMVTEKVEKEMETMRATSWMPMEISLVAVPADDSVGVGRSVDSPALLYDTEVETQQNQIKDMATESETRGLPGTEQPAYNPETSVEVNEENTRVDGINKIALLAKQHKVSGIDELHKRALFDKTINERQFRKMVLDLLPKGTQPVREAEPLNIPAKEWRQYSLTKILRNQISPSQYPLDGLEAEVNAEMALKLGKRAEGCWVPRDAFVMANQGQRNFIAGTGTLGGMLVETQNLGGQFIELLRNRAKVLQLGARVINLANPVTIPRQNAAGAVNWVGETVAATLSTGNFTQITLTPQGLSAFQQYSKQLLFESDPSVDALVREDIMRIIALEIDRVVLHGTGSSQPTGITATTGVTTIALGANGAAFTVANGRASMVSLETAIANSNADVSNMAFLTNSRVRGRLRMIDESQATNVARWVWQGGGEDSGRIMDYRAEVSNQVSAIQTQGTATTICSSVFFGNWSEILIAQFNGGATDLIVDPYTLAVNAVVRIIARHWVDVGVRHGASFSVLLGVLDA